MKAAHSASQSRVLAVGSFVFTGDSAGIGKVERHESTTCQVRLFYSIARQETRAYPTGALRPALLAPQTRVYFQQLDGNWLFGRVVDLIDDDDVVSYDIALPNSKSERVPEVGVYTRCYSALTDPTEALAWNGMETQYFHDRRLGAMQALLDARAVGRGLSGLLSASVELAPHQVEVVRRVLEDPIQRYLLADEVGMGKTIEAGAIIRQCLLDNPASRIMVLAPEPLLRQWEQELHTKFHLEDFPASVEILSHEAIAAQEEASHDLLVIDEAHHLIARQRVASGVLAHQPSFVRLAQLAHRSTRLLLLSATPIIGNDEATLALLHLLDPTSYKLEDREAFRQKLERRQEYGRLLLAITPGAAPFVRRLTAKKLRDTFPEDAEVAKWAAQLEPSDTPDDRERADRAARSVQRHIAETYRLHQRLIRSRRKDTEGWELRPRNGNLTVDADADERIPALCDALEEWRYQARSALNRSRVEGADLTHRVGEINSILSGERAFAHRYARLVEALGVSVETLEAEWKRQRAEARAGALPTFPGDDGVDRQLADALAMDPGDETRLGLATQAISLAVKAAGRVNSAPKIVAFTSSTAFGRAVRSHLETELGRDAICAIFADDGGDQIDRAVKQFTDSPRALVMLCDRSGEEGFNFHFAHSIVHLDLPLDPARIEQRIGRVDRFGRTYDSINQRVILPTDDDNSPWAIWLRALRDGLHIFEESVSEVQLLLDQLAEEVALALFRNETHTGERLVRLIQTQVRDERIKLDEQYALDRLNLSAGGASALSPALKEFEANASRFGLALDRWMYQVLQLRDWQTDGVANVFKVQWSKRTLVPKQPWYHQFLQGLDRASTYLRSTSVRKPDLHLLRPGAPLVDAVEHYMRWDDRGAAFATWRVAPAWVGLHGGEWLGFRLCYTVEADMRRQLGIDEALDEDQQLLIASVQRRADAYLPPAMTVLHLDAGFSEVTDSTLLELLQRPYSNNDAENGHRDYNLGSRREALESLIDQTEFMALCRQVRVRSEELLRQSDAYQTLVAHVTQRAQAEITLRNERLQLRAEALRREQRVTAMDIVTEIRANDAILTAVANPTIRLDAIGFFVLAGEPPKEMT